jgi:hypothetical protein
MSELACETVHTAINIVAPQAEVPSPRAAIHWRTHNAPEARRGGLRQSLPQRTFHTLRE